MGDGLGDKRRRALFAFVVLTIFGTAMWHAHGHDVPIVQACQEAFLAILLDGPLQIALALMATVAGLRGGKKAVYARASELSKLRSPMI